jgi:transposase
LSPSRAVIRSLRCGGRPKSRPGQPLCQDPWAQRSRIPEFVKTGATIRRNKDGITAAIERGLSNGRHEGLNNKIRTMTRRAYGFHSPQAALALIMLTCGPTTLTLPYHT